MSKNNAIPVPCRALVKKARMRKHANNKGKPGSPTSVIRCSEVDTRAYDALPNEDKTVRARNGSWFRLHWSTPEEREAERIRLGA